MKKTFLLALAVLASASFNVAVADKKNDKKKNTVMQTALVLNGTNDSLSYAGGMAATRGLIPFVQQQYQVDTTYMADFIQGIKDARGKIDDPKYNAYIAGTQIASMLEKRIMTQIKNETKGTSVDINEEAFVNGFLASLNNDHSVYTTDNAAKVFDGRMKAEKEAAQKVYKAENEAWLAANTKKEGVKITSSGLQYKVLVDGNGDIPKATDEVEVKYEGKMIDGTVFDSSYKRNPQTTKFHCNQVIKGWTEALTMMHVGSKWEIYIPQDLAYGERQAGQIKPYSTLVFTVELVGISAPQTPATPKTATSVTGPTGENNSGAIKKPIKRNPLIKGKAKK